MTKEEKKQYNKEYYEANKDKRKNNMKEYREANKGKIKEYREANKGKIKEYREANKDKIKAQQKEYQEANKDKIKEYREANKGKKNKWYVNYYNNDPLFKLTVKVRSLITTSLKKRNYKKSSRTAEILGCSYDVFKVHIEEQFPKDMTWDNSSLWHYDHIKPVSSATSEEELLRLNHYTNFQPLWEEDNLEKSARLDWVKCLIKYAK